MARDIRLGLLHAGFPVAALDDLVVPDHDHRLAAADALAEVPVNALNGIRVVALVFVAGLFPSHFAGLERIGLRGQGGRLPGGGASCAMAKEPENAAQAVATNNAGTVKRFIGFLAERGNGGRRKTRALKPGRSGQLQQVFNSVPRRIMGRFSS